MPLARPQFGNDEVAAVVEVLQSGQLCQGEVTERFESAFAQLLGVRHAVAVSSGSAALLVAMQAVGVGPGDEVIVPDMTFVSTASAAMYLGARPVFCDISLRDYCIDSDRIAALITGRTKLIVPVHFGGRIAEMDAINAIAKDHGLSVLEDAAGAHLSQRGGRFAGPLGDAGIFSFTPTKPITTGEGGMITTDDDEIARRCRLIRNFGDDGKFAWHSLGFNFRMTALSAALGREQLKQLPQQVRQRREIARRYDEAFRGASLQTCTSESESENNFQLYPLLIDVDALNITRDEVIAQLGRRGVASRLYYPALHRMGVFQHLNPPGDENFPAALEYQRRAICLPIFGGLTLGEQQHVIDTLKDIIATASRGAG